VLPPGAPLHMGRVTEEGLECGYHGLVFGTDGVCVRVPVRDRIPERGTRAILSAGGKDGFLWIWMGDPALADPSAIVSYPWHNDTVNWPHKHTMYPIQGRRHADGWTT